MADPPFPPFSKESPTITGVTGHEPQPGSYPGAQPGSFPGSVPGSFPGSVAGSMPASSVPYSREPSMDPATSLPPSRIDANVGQVFGGKYKIERILGEGGMGVVYLARHIAIGKKFAIKLLHGEATKDPETVERFKVEAQAASSIGNEHIIDITDFAELPDGATYFVMEHLEGKSVSKLFEDLKRVPTMRLARIAKQIAQGLGDAHTAGIVHRDLKPDNLFLCKRSGGEVDFVKILDFGIAKVGQGANKLTKAGAIFGTPHYMSPEQASGSPVDHRTDIYALGVILYEGAVGRVPFDADNFMGILTQHMYKAPIAPRALPECPPDLSPGLEVIIMRCLRKKPEERYATMEELAEDLDRLMRGEVPKAASEMMALSAGYQSLAQSAMAAGGMGMGMPMPIPGEPRGGAPKRSAWPIFAGIAGVVAVVGIAVFALVGPAKTDAKQTKLSDTQELSKPPPPKETASAAPTPVPTPTVEAPAKKAKSVLVSSLAPSAKLFDGDKELGELPMNVEVEEGSTKKLVLKAPGYVDKPLSLDMKTPAKLSTTMTKAPSSAPAPGGKKHGGEADDPWSKK